MFVFIQWITTKLNWIVFDNIICVGKLLIYNLIIYLVIII